jgi:methylmalonyl-CoA mutase C-terminal domain/subunit
VVAEDADVLGISSLSGSHLVMVPPVIAGLRERGLDRVSVLVGGIIPAEHLDALREVGVDRVFGPGVVLADIAEHIERRVAGRHRVSDPR